MITYPQQLLDVFQWLIRSSFHATVLLCIILLIRSVVQRRFRFQMVYWLWVLLLLRLIWPLNLCRLAFDPSGFVKFPVLRDAVWVTEPFVRL